MITLTVNHNQIEYVGSLEKPIFNLIGEARKVFEGLYTAFSKYQVSLGDFRLDEIVTTPSTFGVNVYLKSQGVYKFRYDRIEWAVANFTEDDQQEFPEVLKRGAEWLRSAASDLSFKTHTFLYTAHCKLSSDDAKTFFLKFPKNASLDMGNGIGDGMIHNWVDPKIDGQFQLVLDHSLSIKNGIFIQFRLILEEDKLDFSTIMDAGTLSLKEALKQVGLQLESEQEI